MVVALLLLALRDVLLPLFTDDPAVLEQAEVVWWFLAGMQPLAGVVFALDGVLMGAGDVGYLRTVTIGSAVLGFLPLSLLAVPLGWGLAGIWTGLCLFIVLRLVAVLARVAGDRWLRAPVTVTGVSPRRPDADVPPGLLLVDKPGGMTSHDVVARARRVLSVRKVGHAGTLDPMATGLLILGVGAATRLLGYVGGHDKTYEATIRLGRRRSPTTARARCSRTTSTAAPGRRRDPRRARRADRPAAAGALVGQRGEGRRPALLRPGARRRGRRARGPLGHRAPARGAPDRAADARPGRRRRHRHLHRGHLHPGDRPRRRRGARASAAT